ncbi:MAG: glycosyltransferase family 4 protein [Nitrososphaerota archaeon]
MKIAHLWYVAPIFGGAETWAIGLTKALRSLGIDTEIVCWRTEGKSKYQHLFKTLGGDMTYSGDLIDYLMYGSEMAKHLAEYDLVCPHHTDVLFPAVFSKSLNGSQVAYILHSPPMGWRRSEEGIISYRHISEKSKQLYIVAKYFMPYCDFFFTNSKWNQRLYERYEGISPVPLLAGVDHDTFRPDKQLRASYRDKLGVDASTVLLFYSSAAGRRKRHEILLRALRQLLKRGIKVKCVLTCSKDRATESFHPLVRRIIQELSLQEHVLAFPAVDENDLPGLYNACDIYVHPANNEHLGMAIIEAMAVGKPIVAQNNGGVPEIVEHGVNGLLFQTDSILGITKNLERLIDDPSMRQEMGEKALEKSKRLDWKEVAKKFLESIS